VRWVNGIWKGKKGDKKQKRGKLADVWRNDLIFYMFLLNKIVMGDLDVEFLF